jgi:type IV pilus assembly protein PilB
VILDDSNNKIQLVTSRPDNVEILRNLEKKVNKPVEVMFAFNDEVVTSLTDPKKQLDDNFEAVKLNALEDITSIESLKNSSKLLDIILINALENKASDIHIEPHEEKLIIRFRVDGDLKDIAELPLELAEIIDTRIKVLADLRIDEHQKPQDGRFKMDLPNGQEITTRVSILPVYKGEKIVMRILESNKQKIQLEDLGYSEANQNIIYGNIVKSHGMILVTGPTGSGKTTTLYTVLKLLNQPDVNLMTVEDPIEYRLDRVNQIQVNEAAGLSFADGLRSILRQDPDVVMVGEIRDQETANIAVNAALTGHLVLATLHTNSAIDTLPRLLEMGVEPFLVASTVNIVVAQRLVRKLCDDCKKAVLFDAKYLAEFINEKSDFASDMLKYSSQYLPLGTTVYEPVGCDKCNNVGYQGRLALAEVLDVNDDIKKLIYAKKAPNEIYDQAKILGFKVLLEDGLDKVAKGWVGLEEIVRVLKE